MAAGGLNAEKMVDMVATASSEEKFRQLSHIVWVAPTCLSHRSSCKFYFPTPWITSLVEKRLRHVEVTERSALFRTMSVNPWTRKIAGDIFEILVHYFLDAPSDDTLEIEWMNKPPDAPNPPNTFNNGFSRKEHTLRNRFFTVP
jgi:hypothetical protein